MIPLFISWEQPNWPESAHYSHLHCNVIICHGCTWCRLTWDQPISYFSYNCIIKDKFAVNNVVSGDFHVFPYYCPRCRPQFPFQYYGTKLANYIIPTITRCIQYEYKNRKLLTLVGVAHYFLNIYWFITKMANYFLHHKLIRAESLTWFAWENLIKINEKNSRRESEELVSANILLYNQ
jgi:hypothetical protein